MNKRKKTVLKKHRRRQRKMKEKQRAFAKVNEAPKKGQKNEKTSSEA